MLNDDQIKLIIEKKISEDEFLGDQAGGSGHLSNTSFQIENIRSKKIDNDTLEITYTYTVVNETEFTYYPDNPPYENTYSNIIVIESDYRKVNKKQN